MMIVSVASAADRQPLAHAYCAIADPSSCATLPKEKASLPFGPKRFGPIWSVPMMFAPWPISLSAHAFDVAGASPCVSQVLSLSVIPVLADLLFQYATRSF